MMTELRRFLKANAMTLLTWGCGLMLLLQVLNLHSYVVQTVDHRAIVGANDDDASWNIAKTVKTRWWKDNGWVLYGPAYFRLNHTINYFWGRTAEVDAGDNFERTAHHSILTISLLSVVGISLLTGLTFLPFWWQRFVFAMAMTSALLSNATWDEFLLRAHPDMLFSVTIAAALLLTIRMLARPSEPIWFILSGILWGVSVSVKMTLSLCAPGFVLLFVPPWTAWRRGLKYLGVMLVAYFAIGFPQTIVLDRPFRELGKINAMSLPANLASAGHRLWTYFDQGKEPLFILILALMCFQTVRVSLDRQAKWRVAAFVGLPFGILLFKNMLVPADHYTIPFLTLLLVFLPLVLPHGRWAERYPLFCALIFFMITLAILGSTPHSLQVALDARIKCRSDARQTYQRVVELVQQGEKVWVDPYIPFPTSAPQSKVELGWEKTWKGWNEGHWTALVLSQNMLGRYASGETVADFARVDNPNWQEIRQFYLSFYNKSETQTPSGTRLKKTYSNSCGQEVWEIMK